MAAGGAKALLPRCVPMDANSQQHRQPAVIDLDVAGGDGQTIRTRLAPIALARFHCLGGSRLEGQRRVDRCQVEPRWQRRIGRDGRRLTPPKPCCLSRALPVQTKPARPPALVRSVWLTWTWRQNRFPRWAGFGRFGPSCPHLGHDSDPAHGAVAVAVLVHGYAPGHAEIPITIRVNIRTPVSGAGGFACRVRRRDLHPARPSTTDSAGEQANFPARRPGHRRHPERVDRPQCAAHPLRR